MINWVGRRPDSSRFACRVLALALVLIGVGTSGCKNNSPSEPILPQLPALTDSIPFEQLGGGKLIFQRIGPQANAYSGAYVLDISQKRSWGISGEVNGPAVSPDGQMIAYTTYATVQTAYDVFIMNSDGGARQRVSDIAGQEHCPSWTYDGKQILFFAFPFSLSDGFTPLYRQSPVPNPTDRVVIVDPGKQSLPFGIEGPVSVSSTGKLLCTGGDVHTINSDGSGLALVASRSGSNEQLYSAVWSPAGQGFALLSVRRDTMRIVSVAVLLFASGGGVADTLVSLPASGVTEPSGDNSYSLCWSPDGSRIAFTRPDGQTVGSHIYLIKKDHSGLTQVTFEQGVTDRSLSWGR